MQSSLTTAPVIQLIFKTVFLSISYKMARHVNQFLRLLPRA